MRAATLVCAPAGFGKTSLLADWARSGDRPVAWLSLDPGDNDPVRFWRYVAAALDRAGAAGPSAQAAVTNSGVAETWSRRRPSPSSAGWA